MTYSYDSHTVDNDMTVSKPVAWQDIWCLLSVVVVLKMAGCMVISAGYPNLLAHTSASLFVAMALLCPDSQV